MTSLSTLKLLSFVSKEKMKTLRTGYYTSDTALEDRYPDISPCNDVKTFYYNIHQYLKGLCILSIQANDRLCKLQNEGEECSEEENERNQDISEEDRAQKRVLKEGEVLCQFYSFEVLDKEDQGLEAIPEFVKYVDELVKYHLIEGENDKDGNSKYIENYPSLFEYYFTFFTGIGHGKSPQNYEKNDYHFVKQAERIVDFLKRTDDECLHSCMKDRSKRQRLDSISATGFETVKTLVDRFNNIETDFSNSHKTKNPLSYRLEIESIKTQLLEIISTQCSNRYIALQEETFYPDCIKGKMSDSFSQLLRYLHFAVPPEGKDLTLLDRYYLSVLSAIRVFYVHAIQQACLVILLNRARNWSRSCLVMYGHHRYHFLSRLRVTEYWKFSSDLTSA